MAALPRYNPRFVAGFARQYARAPRSRSAAASLSARHALRRLRHRTRPGRPPARAELRRRRALACSASTTTRSAWRRSRERPDAVQGARHRRAARPRRRSTSPAAPPTPRRPTRSCSRSARRRFSHIEIDMRDIRTVLDDLLPHAARGPAARPALDRRARHDRVRRRLPREAARLPRRRGHLRRPRARADRRRPLHGRDRDAAVHRRRRRRGAPASAPARLFEPLGAPIVQTTPVQAELAKIWTNILRYATFALPEPADDGLRALRRERLRRHRADQPRLPARRHGAAGPDRGHLPAQGLRVLRGALERPGHAARRLARARERAAVPRRRRQAPARRRRCASARSPCSGSRSRPTPTTSATRSRTS